MSYARLWQRFVRMHHVFPETKPLTLAVTFGSIVAVGFPVFSYCQNMEVGYGKDYTASKQMKWYNYIFPTRRQHFSENEESVESLRKQLFKETNKSS